MDAPEGVLPTREHTKKSPEGKVLLDVELSDDIMPTWREMEKLVDQGLVKSIGVSNLNINRVKKLLKDARIKPVTNQVELSIQCPQFELVDWLHKQNIQPQGYSPLGGTDGAALRENADIKKIADKHNVGATTIMLSWLVKRGINPLPKSCTPSRIDENLKLIDLTEDEFESVNKIARSTPHKRVCDQSNDFEPVYDIYQENHPEYNDKVQATKP